MSPFSTGPNSPTPGCSSQLPSSGSPGDASGVGGAANKKKTTLELHLDIAKSFLLELQKWDEVDEFLSIMASDLRYIRRRNPTAARLFQNQVRCYVLKMKADVDAEEISRYVTDRNKRRRGAPSPDMLPIQCEEFKAEEVVTETLEAGVQYLNNGGDD